MVTHNNRDDIAPCLDSLAKNRSACTLHICLIDNASTDGTQNHIREIAQRQPFDTFVEPIFNDKNAGFTHAVNQGLAQARSSAADYILFLNPDVVLPANAIRSLLPLFAEHDAGVVAPQLINEDGSLQPSCRRFPRHRDVLFAMTGLAACFRRSAFWNGWKMGDFDHKTSRAVDQPQGAFLLAKRQVVDEIGDWDQGFPMFFSDVDWCLRAKCAGNHIWFSAEVRVLHHRGRSVKARRAQMILSSHRSFIRYFYKHFRGWRWALANALIAVLLVFSGMARYIAAQMVAIFKKSDERIGKK